MPHAADPVHHLALLHYRGRPCPASARGNASFFAVAWAAPPFPLHTSAPGTQPSPHISYPLSQLVGSGSLFFFFSLFFPERKKKEKKNQKKKEKRKRKRRPHNLIKSSTLTAPHHHLRYEGRRRQSCGVVALNSLPGSITPAAPHYQDDLERGGCVRIPPFCAPGAVAIQPLGPTDSKAQLQICVF